MWLRLLSTSKKAQKPGSHEVPPLNSSLPEPPSFCLHLDRWAGGNFRMFHGLQRKWREQGNSNWEAGGVCYREGGQGSPLWGGDNGDRDGAGHGRALPAEEAAGTGEWCRVQGSQTWFEFFLCLFWAMCLWPSHMASWSLSFPTYKVGMIIPTSEDWYEE